jgi:hypothetical protein
MINKYFNLCQEKICSKNARLDVTSLAMVLGGLSTVEGTGGCSCGQTGSSCGCDSTAVCNCPPPSIKFPTKP